MVMTPPQMQFRVDVLFRAGMLPIMTVAEPGTQGAGVAGIQGAGVKTPLAADVAAMTAGLVGALHMPKGITLVIGMLSMMVAAGTLLVLTSLAGSTVSVDGATPNEQAHIAPLQTSCAMRLILSALSSVVLLLYSGLAQRLRLTAF